MRKVLVLVSLVLVLVGVLAGTVLAADGSGIRPTWVSVMADGSGIRPGPGVMLASDGSGIRPA